MPPLGRLEYLYVGSKDVGADVKFYRDVLGARVVFDLTGFGARVAAVEMFERPPLVLLADHRKAGTVLPIFVVPSLAEAERELTSRGWGPKGESFEVPDGPCIVFEDSSGNEYAMLEQTRPRALEQAED